MIRNPASRAYFVILSICGTLCSALPVAADLVKVRYRETAARGFVALSELSGSTIAYGEMSQWLEDDVVVNRLVIHFNDGSLYDEHIRFSQERTFRLLSYKLVQEGPSFSESSEVEFDRSGQYRVRRKSGPEAEAQNATGKTDIPADVTNGMTSLLLKNLNPRKPEKMHLMAFTPEPRALDLWLAPEGEDKFWVGPTERTATRFLVQPRVSGVQGAIATVIGKQPPAFRMWIAQGKAPTLVRFEGPLYADGPVWRLEMSAPQWIRKR